MASITKYSGGYRAQVFVRGIRDSQTFPTKREASAWASERETELRAKAKTPSSVYTLGEALRKFGEEVSPTHKGENWELVRLRAFERQLPIAKKIGDVAHTDISAWRDKRLETVSPSTVLREIKLLNSVFEAARRDWHWIDSNPCKDVRKPSEAAHRERTITGIEVRGVLRALGWSRGVPKSITQSLANCFLFALCTGMRSSEMVNLTWARVHEKHVSLSESKTGAGRDVPLSTTARRILGYMRGFDPVTVFGLSHGTRDALFRKATARAGLQGFTFHDARHTAATRIAKRLDVLSLCKVFGWSDPKRAMVYFNPKARDMADLL